MRGILAVLGLLCVILGVIVFQKWPREESHADVNLTTQDILHRNRADHSDRAIVSPVVTPQVQKGEPVPAPIDRPSIDEPPPDDALADERIFQFKDARKAREFALAAREAGHEVLWVSGPLGAVRVRATSREALAELARLAGEDAQLDYNYPVYLPSSPALDGGFLGGMQHFNEAPLEWLGAPGTPDWGRGVKVAIIDTGVHSHPSLAGSRITQLDLVNSGRSGDFSSHGTASASLIVGDGQHVKGVAPGVELLSVRVMDGSGIGDAFTLAAGIVEAVDRGANVITIPLGTYSQSSVLSAAVEYASSRGIAIVASAGNDGVRQPLYPAAYPDVIAVGAVDKEGNRASFSNGGDWLDIVAPGVAVPAAWGGDREVIFTGTSPAAPLVAGGIAGLISERPGLSPKAAAKLLLETAFESGPPGMDEFTGAGIVNFDAARRARDPNVIDVSVAPLFFNAAALQETGQGQMLVMVQNTGTANANFSLSIEVDGLSLTASQQNLPPREVAVVPVVVDPAKLQSPQGIPFRVAVSTTSGKDERPNNNERSGILRLTAPEE